MTPSSEKRHVDLIDVSLRDGNQSLWSARGVTSELVEQAAPWIDRVGYSVCEFITSTIMAMAIKHQREDPWERIRRASELMPNTPLGFLTTGKRFITWNRTPDSLLEMAYELLARNGIRRFWVCDPMVEAEGARENAALAKKVGAEQVVVGLVYSISPVHTDDFYRQAAADLDGCPDIDAVYLKDPGGLLTPDRLTTLVPAIREGLKETPLWEVHSHCNTGLSPRTVLDAVDLGIDTVHCAAGPAANGTSHPPARRLVGNLEARGYTTSIDLEALAEYERVLDEHVESHGLPKGRPLEYDERYFEHQMPGGMVSTVLHQLREIGREDLMPAIQEEVGQVRADFGYPIMVTPFSQVMASQALLNVLGDERYGSVSDDTALYVLGDYGQPPVPVDAALRDRAEEVAKERGLSVDREQPTRADLKRRFGNRSDEDLLMCALISAEEVDAMRAGAPVEAEIGTTRKRAVSASVAPASTARSSSVEEDPLEPLLRTVVDQLERNPHWQSFSIAGDGMQVEITR